MLRRRTQAYGHVSVTTHLPNALALKMDGAEASHLNSTDAV